MSSEEQRQLPGRGAKAASLRIVPNEAPLMRPSPLQSDLRWPEEKGDQQPRALRSLSRIISDGLCHRCGSCIGICPTKVLGLDGESYPQVKNLSACTDCDLCVKVCPGDEFDVHEASRRLFGAEANLTDIHGHFSEACIAYATDPDVRERSTSGGLVTALLLYLLEQKLIDGALVISSDSEVLWKGKAVVARSRDELLAAMKSKYAITPTNAGFAEIREVPGRYAIVGLPCQIHGYVKAAELDERIRERVVLTIGLYCHAAVEHEAFKIIWKSLGERATRARRFISRIGKHPGTPHLELDDGSLYPVYFGEAQGYRPSSMEVINIIYRLYTPARCLTCFDASAEFADIAVGDPWMAPPKDEVDFLEGWSFALARTERGRKVLADAVQAGQVRLESLTRREALACNSIMGTEKRHRAFRIIETLKRQGRAVPAYGPYEMKMPRQSGKQFLKTELHMLTHIFCYLPQRRAAVLKFMLGRGGYALLWLNHKRRALRFWLRDTKERVRRRLVGRGS